MPRFLFSLLLSLLVALAAAFVAGCTPHIGDHCNLNTDCSIQGTLFCDTSQPNGYCTFFNCVPGGCQNNAVCVMLRPSVPGCPYDDYQSPSRTGRTMCLAPCSQDSDCRQSEGYVCVDPTTTPWKGIVMDQTQGQKVCMVSPDQSVPASFMDAGVCQPTADAGPLDASVHLVDAGGAGAEAGPDAGAEAGADAGAGVEAGPDAGPDAPGSD
jgi:hypothetical protein